MDKPKKSRGSHNEFPIEDDMCLTGAASSGDCTGLIPEGSVDSADKYEETNRVRRYGAPRNANKA